MVEEQPIPDFLAERSNNKNLSEHLLTLTLGSFGSRQTQAVRL